MHGEQFAQSCRRRLVGSVGDLAGAVDLGLLGFQFLRALRVEDTQRLDHALVDAGVLLLADALGFGRRLGCPGDRFQPLHVEDLRAEPFVGHALQFAGVGDFDALLFSGGALARRHQRPHGEIVLHRLLRLPCRLVEVPQRGDHLIAEQRLQLFEHGGRDRTRLHQLLRLCQRAVAADRLPRDERAPAIAVQRLAALRHVEAESGAVADLLGGLLGFESGPRCFGGGGFRFLHLSQLRDIRRVFPELLRRLVHLLLCRQRLRKPVGFRVCPRRAQLAHPKVSHGQPHRLFELLPDNRQPLRFERVQLGQYPVALGFVLPSAERRLGLLPELHELRACLRQRLREPVAREAGAHGVQRFVQLLLCRTLGNEFLRRVLRRAEQPADAADEPADHGADQVADARDHRASRRARGRASRRTAERTRRATAGGRSHGEPRAEAAHGAANGRRGSLRPAHPLAALPHLLRALLRPCELIQRRRQQSDHLYGIVPRAVERLRDVAQGAGHRLQRAVPFPRSLHVRVRPVRRVLRLHQLHVCGGQALKQGRRDRDPLAAKLFDLRRRQHFGAIADGIGDPKPHGVRVGRRDVGRLLLRLHELEHFGETHLDRFDELPEGDGVLDGALTDNARTERGLIQRLGEILARLLGVALRFGLPSGFRRHLALHGRQRRGGREQRLGLLVSLGERLRERARDRGRVLPLLTGQLERLGRLRAAHAERAQLAAEVLYLREHPRGRKVDLGDLLRGSVQIRRRLRRLLDGLGGLLLPRAPEVHGGGDGREARDRNANRAGNRRPRRPSRQLQKRVGRRQGRDGRHLRQQRGNHCPARRRHDGRARLCRSKRQPAGAEGDRYGDDGVFVLDHESRGFADPTGQRAGRALRFVAASDDHAERVVELRQRLPDGGRDLAGQQRQLFTLLVKGERHTAAREFARFAHLAQSADRHPEPVGDRLGDGRQLLHDRAQFVATQCARGERLPQLHEPCLGSAGARIGQPHGIAHRLRHRHQLRLRNAQLIRRAREAGVQIDGRRVAGARVLRDGEQLLLHPGEGGPAAGHLLEARIEQRVLVDRLLQATHGERHPERRPRLLERFDGALRGLVDGVERGIRLLRALLRARRIDHHP